MAVRRGQSNQLVDCFSQRAGLASPPAVGRGGRDSVDNSGKARRTETEAGQARARRIYLRAAERRELILAAAREVFTRSHLNGARTRDIARAASVNQATIFEHFESKEALFQAAVVEPLIRAMAGMQARRETYETAASSDELAGLAQESAERHVADMLEIFPLLTTVLFSDPDLGRQLYREHLAPLLRRRGKILDGLVRDGLDLDFVSLANFGMTFAIALDQQFGEHDESRPADVAEIARQFTRMSTGGFARRERAPSPDKKKSGA
jgi:AcrR family transcriptional regulator